MALTAPRKWKDPFRAVTGLEAERSALGDDPFRRKEEKRISKALACKNDPRPGGIEPRWSVSF